MNTEWKDLKCANVLRELGSYGPTVRVEEKMLKGSHDGGKSYMDSHDLRELAAACTEAADWLDARAGLESAAPAAPPVAAIPAQTGMAESVPASIDTPEFAELLALWAATEHSTSVAVLAATGHRETLIAHTNAWGAQQREAGRQEGALVSLQNYDAACQEYRDQIAELRQRAEKAEAALAERAAGDTLREVIEVLRQYPDFDGDNPYGVMMDEALAGLRPSMLDTIDALADGRKPAAPAVNGAGIVYAKQRDLDKLAKHHYGMPVFLCNIDGPGWVPLAIRAPATPAPAMGEELPPLPNFHAMGLFSADQMHAYGRACMALRQPESRIEHLLIAELREEVIKLKAKLVVCKTLRQPVAVVQTDLLAAAELLGQADTIMFTIPGNPADKLNKVQRDAYYKVHCLIREAQGALDAMRQSATTPVIQPVADPGEDTRLLDWFDTQRTAYGFEDVQEGNEWLMSGPFPTLRHALRECMKSGAATAPVSQPAAQEALPIIADWPFCNPGCDYEDPHGGMHDQRSVSCCCEAAKASIARQRASAPQPITAPEPAAPVPSEPFCYVIVDKSGEPDFVTKERTAAQEHINDACADSVPGAGKWKAVPVFTWRPTDDQLWDQTIRDRDTYHEWADKLAEAIAAYFGVDIGEHSNQNCPWAEALEAVPAARAVGGVDKVKCPYCKGFGLADNGDCEMCSGGWINPVDIDSSQLDGSQLSAAKDGQAPTVSDSQLRTFMRATLYRSDISYHSNERYLDEYLRGGGDGCSIHVEDIKRGFDALRAAAPAAPVVHSDLCIGGEKGPCNCGAVPADPMDWPLPCDVKVGHGTIRKGCSLRTLVLRMQVLYDMTHKAAPAGEPVSFGRSEPAVQYQPQPPLPQDWGDDKPCLTCDGQPPHCKTCPEEGGK